MSLGRRIKDLRTAKKLTQQEIADRLGKGRSNMGHIENDRVIPSSEDLQKIADILETSTDYLLGRQTNQVAESPAPYWASSRDLKDLKKILEDGDIMFDGVPIDDQNRQRIMDVLTGLFWEAKQMNKETYGRRSHTKNSTSDGDNRDKNN